MGLYDRDYMRGKSAPEDEGDTGLERLVARRRWLVWGGAILLFLGAMAAWFAN